MASTCPHVEETRSVSARTPNGCEECLESGGRWVHLRLCLTCGHVGCCDSSPGKHATKHFHRSQHPIIRSYEQGEDWAWCYADQVMIQPAPHGRNA
jgi:CPA1 family monovalent cation:H+ antiporter